VGQIKRIEKRYNLFGREGGKEITLDKSGLGRREKPFGS
jgi:hypothetical protein